jgi:peptide/nickel transport system ATP-binding protein
METPNLLEVRDLSISFGTEAGEAHVLDGVNLLGILPPNARRHRGGSIGFRREDLLTYSGERFDREVRGRRITFIPQDPYSSLNPLFKVGSQVMELMKWKSPRRDDFGTGRGLTAFATRYPRSRRRADREAVLDMLRAVQIPQPESIFSKLPGEFSGGQRQRLMIAMALLPEPDLVIADEPTTALDVTIQAQILKLLRTLARDRGVSIMLTTHDLGAAYEICDRITVMYAGQEVETAPVGDFFEHSSHRYTRRLLESLPNPNRPVKGIGGEVPTLIHPPPGCRFHPRCSHAVGPCARARPEVTVLGRGHEVRCYNPELAGVEDAAAPGLTVQS